MNNNMLLSATITHTYEVFMPIIIFLGLVGAGTIIMLAIIGLFQKGKPGKIRDLIIAIIFAAVLILLVVSMTKCEIKASVESNDLPKWLGLLYIAIELFVVGVYIALESKNTKDK